jgi:hypothetical protein
MVKSHEINNGSEGFKNQTSTFCISADDFHKFLATFVRKKLKKMFLVASMKLFVKIF